MKKVLLFALSIVILTSCHKDNAVNRFAKNEIYIRIADLQDKRSSDSLQLYLKDDDAAVRRNAVLAFGSVQDSTVVEGIADLLSNDTNADVRKAAAFALGQTRCRESETALTSALKNEKDLEVRDEIIEAYGKVAKRWGLEIDTAYHTTSIAWSLYRAGLNGAVDSTKNALAAAILKNGNSQARLGAAHFFARGAKKISASFSVIADRALDDKQADVRMAATSALRKILTDSSFQTLEKIFNRDSDYRVRISAVRAFHAFHFERSKNYLLKALDHKNVNVAIASAEAIRSTITEALWVEVANKADAQKNWRVQTTLYDAVLKVKANKFLSDELKKSFDQTTSPYHRAGILTALSNIPENYEFIAHVLSAADTPIVRSSAADAIVAINYNKGFKPEWKTKFADIYAKEILKGDAAVIASFSQALADSTLGYRNTIKDYTFLTTAKSNLSLPKDNEILQSLEAAIAHFEHRKFVNNLKNDYNHPIAWNDVKEISSDYNIEILTTKGKITMRMLVDEAPGSVLNFIQLAKRGYFDGKFFHRVVPNFVAQGGCPRGDGFGGEDYSIRSEFSERKYKTGSVGMASAGKDTEGTQWFITHSPTPHLDGRYTIFAEVIEGMEAVHQLEVGDQIVSVSLPTGRK